MSPRKLRAEGGVQSLQPRAPRPSRGDAPKSSKDASTSPGLPGQSEGEEPPGSSHRIPKSQNSRGWHVGSTGHADCLTPPRGMPTSRGGALRPKAQGGPPGLSDPRSPRPALGLQSPSLSAPCGGQNPQLFRALDSFFPHFPSFSTLDS